MPTPATPRHAWMGAVAAAVLWSGAAGAGDGGAPFRWEAHFSEAAPLLHEASYRFHCRAGPVDAEWSFLASPSRGGPTETASIRTAPGGAPIDLSPHLRPDHRAVDFLTGLQLGCGGGDGGADVLLAYRTRELLRREPAAGGRAEGLAAVAPYLVPVRIVLKDGAVHHAAQRAPATRYADGPETDEREPARPGRVEATHRFRCAGHPVELAWIQEAGKLPEFRISTGGRALDPAVGRAMAGFLEPGDQLVGAWLVCQAHIPPVFHLEVHYRRHERRRELDPSGDVPAGPVETDYYAPGVHTFVLRDGALVQAVANRFYWYRT